MDQHGNRLEKDGALTVLAERYQGKRLNSPNDLVYRSDGALFFTDPPFGLPKFFADRRKELAWSGVYALVEGKPGLVTRDLQGPNGIAFSPDEKYLYVGNWDDQKKVVMRYEVRADGAVASGQVFFDMTGTPGEDAIDGIKVDERGNWYVSGPGGLWILSPPAGTWARSGRRATPTTSLGRCRREDPLPLRAQHALSDEAGRGRRGTPNGAIKRRSCGTAAPEECAGPGGRGGAAP